MVPVWARYLSIKLLEYRKGRLLSLSVSVSASFDLLLCAIGAVSLLRSRKLKNDPAGLRKWGRFCAVDRGIGYRLAEQCLCSNRPPPPSCISCPSVCRWWICCVEKRWNNSLFQRLPGADLRHKRFSSKQREPLPVLIPEPDREGDALLIKKLQLQTQTVPVVVAEES